MGREGDSLRAVLVAEQLTKGAVVRLRADSHSMTPFVRAGDVVTLEPLRGRPRLGDVVAVATADGRLLVHRLIGWQGEQALTRGDVADHSDAPVPLEAVLGLVTRVERGARSVRLGPGVERRAIAFLSRAGLLRLLARARERLRRSVPGPG